MTPWNVLEPGPKGKVPNVIHVFVEIPKGAREKYELNKESGILFLDRDLFTSMVYPGDYGFVPKTLCEDGDPVDALILVSQPHFPGVVIRARPIGLLKMIDENGRDDKVICVPDDKTDPRFKNIRDVKDVHPHLIKEIKHFFKHMKELEPGKWVTIERVENAEKAKKFINDSILLYEQKYKVKGGV